MDCKVVETDRAPAAILIPGFLSAVSLDYNLKPENW